MSQQINLFNPVLLKQEKMFSALAMAQGLGLIVLGLAALVGYFNYRVGQLRQDAVKTAAELASTEDRLKQQAERIKPKERNKQLDLEIAAAQTRLNERRRVLDFVQHGELGNSRGYSEYFRAFARQNVNGLWLTGFTLLGAGSDISIEGRALRPELVPGYLLGLKRDPVFRGKSLATMTMRHVQPEAVPAEDGKPVAAPPAYIEFTLGSREAAAPGAGQETPGAVTGGLPGSLPGPGPGAALGAIPGAEAIVKGLQ